MPSSRQDMRYVELVEGADAPGDEPSRPPEPPGEQSPRGLPPRPAAALPRGRTLHRLVAGVVLVVALVVADVASDARSRAATAALADVPGVLAPLDGPVRELWRSDRALRPELLPAGDLLVGVLVERRSADVVALDPATGEEVWRTVVRQRGPGGGGVRCVVPQAPAPPSESDASALPPVVCVVDREVPRRHDARRQGSTDRILVLDAASGAVLSERPVEGSTALAALGSDVVTGHVAADGRVHVTRTDPAGTGTRWTFRTPDRMPRLHPGWAARVRVVDDLVLLDEADGWVLSADGRVLHSWATSTGAQLDGTADVIGGGRFLTRPHADGGPWPRTEITDLGSGRSFVVNGRPVRPTPDDRSTGGWVLVRAGGSGSLVAHDPDTGLPAWSVPGSVETRSMAVGGQLVRLGSAGLSAVETATGTQRRATPVTRTARGSLVTDGRLAVVSALDPDLGVVLEAYGLDDGRLRWRTDVADDLAVLVVFGKHLFAWTGEQVVALG